MLAWKDICFAYTEGDAILEGTSLALEPGRVTVLTGPSGSGKSTMLYLAAGVYPRNAGMLQRGSVTIGGRNVGDIPPEERAHIVGMLFQNPDLQFCMDTVLNELIFTLENVSTAPGDMDSIIENALTFCGITHLKKRRLLTLSGGEKQKVMLSCIVALNPKWILLDEPFANIDEGSAREIAEKLALLQKERGTGIVAVDHHLDIWLALADELIVLQKGGGIALQTASPASLSEEGFASLGVSLPGQPYQSKKPQKTPGTLQPLLQLIDMGATQEETPILHGCNAEFFRGRIHAIWGKSGSGKSTLFGALCRLNPYSGSILLCGRELHKLPRRQLSQRIGFVFQNPQDQFVSGNVLEEIVVSLKGRMPKGEAHVEAERLLRGGSLWRYRQVSPYMLSQGQQRRLAVIALLAYGCDILVCDEPTYAQDRRSLLAIMDSLQEQVTQRGLTLIFSTHDRMLARNYADIHYEIQDGTIR